MAALALATAALASICARAADVCWVAAACCWEPRLICSTAAMIWAAALDSSWIVAESCSAVAEICSAAEASARSARRSSISVARPWAATWPWSSDSACWRTADCASLAPADCSSAALATCSAPRCASPDARSASSAAVSVPSAPAASLAMSWRMASSVSTTRAPELASVTAVSAADFTCSTTPPTSRWIVSARPRTSCALFSDVSASARTSSATTAKPRPWSPARAASMAAFSAKRLVWSEMRLTVPVISPMSRARRSSSAMMASEACWRWALRSMARTDAVIWPELSASTACRTSVRRREASPWTRAVVRLPTTFLIAASCSCEAPAASSPPAAICSMARRSSSAAAEASARPLASSSAAAAIRSAILSGRAPEARAAGFGRGAVGTAAGFGADAAIFEVFTRGMTLSTRDSA